MAKKQERHNEMLENPEAIQEKLITAENWLERNAKLVIVVVAAIVVGLAAFFGLQYYKQQQNLLAQEEMFQAIYYFEADSLDLALNGNGNDPGFLAIIDEYGGFGGTDASNLANYYTGAIYLKQGKFDVARMYLEDFKAGDLLIQARAYSLIGDTYMEEKNYEEAARFYKKAAEYKPNKFFSPTYHMKEALAYEKANQPDKAAETYDKVINQYWDSQEVQRAKKFRARIKGNS